MGPTSRLRAGFRAMNWQRFEDNQLCRDKAKVAQVQEAPTSQSWLGPSVRGKLKADLTMSSQCLPTLVPDTGKMQALLNCRPATPHANTH